MATTINELRKAIKTLDVALQLYKDSLSSDIEIQRAFRDACIQRFEYCIELSWKTSMKMLGSQTSAAKVAIREMARNNLIPNPECWLEFVELRNSTSHAYAEDVARLVFAAIGNFSAEAQKLLVQLINLEKIS